MRDGRPALAAPQWINGALRLPHIGALVASNALLVLATARLPPLAVAGIPFAKRPDARYQVVPEVRPRTNTGRGVHLFHVLVLDLGAEWRHGAIHQRELRADAGADGIDVVDPDPGRRPHALSARRARAIHRPEARHPRGDVADRLRDVVRVRDGQGVRRPLSDGRPARH